MYIWVIQNLADTKPGSGHDKIKQKKPSETLNWPQTRATQLIN